MDRITDQKLDAKALAQEVEKLRAQIGPKLPDIDAGDLVLILQSLLRPVGSGRRFLLRLLRPNVYVP